MRNKKLSFLCQILYPPIMDFGLVFAIERIKLSDGQTTVTSHTLTGRVVNHRDSPLTNKGVHISAFMWVVSLKFIIDFLTFQTWFIYYCKLELLLLLFILNNSNIVWHMKFYNFRMDFGLIKFVNLICLDMFVKWKSKEMGLEINCLFQKGVTG